MNPALHLPDAERAEALVLSVVTGDAVPRARTLYRGHRVESLTIGTRGDWHVEAPGVVPIHAALHFDGSNLYVWGSSLGSISVNGKPVPESWTPVSFPAVMLLGEARIVLLGPRTKAARRSIPAASPPSKGTVRPWEAPPPASEHDEAATRLVDIEQLLPRVSSPPLQPAVVVASLAPISTETAASVPPRRDEEPTLRRRIPASALALWKGVPFTTRIASAILVLGAGMFLLPSGARGARETSAAPVAPAASSLASAAAVPAAAAAPAALEASVKQAELPAPAASPSAKVSSAKGPTEQWRAVNAVVSGNNAEAVALYEELSRTQPDSVPYREALRILRQGNR